LFIALIAIVTISRGAATFALPRPGTPPSASDQGARKAIMQFIQAQNERNPGLMAPVLADKFQTLSAGGKVIVTEIRAKMLAGLQQGSDTQTMRLSLAKLVVCGSKRATQTWATKDPTSETGTAKNSVKMIPGEARALVNVQVRFRVSPTQEQTDSGQFIFYLKRQAGKWLVYASQPG